MYWTTSPSAPTNIFVSINEGGTYFSDAAQGKKHVESRERKEERKEGRKEGSGGGGDGGGGGGG